MTRQLARSPYLAGDRFTAADISVTYALELAQRNVGFVLGEAEQAYVARTTGREAHKRAMETCQATKEWAAAVAGQYALLALNRRRSESQLASARGRPLADVAIVGLGRAGIRAAHTFV